MTYDISPIVIFVVGVSIIPAIVAYDRLRSWWLYRNKKRKIAEFIEKAAEQQIQAKDGPE